MHRPLVILALLLFSVTGPRVFGQYGETKPDTVPENVLLLKQWTLGAMIHSNGWGLKFRKAKNLTALRQFTWEIEFSTYKSSKEVKTINPYFSDSRAYIYGKLNYVWFLRGGVGQQRILNRKPYWGGVQLSWIYDGGFSLGFSKPVYLYIVHFNSGFTEYTVEEEKYDPAKHFTDNIYGRGSFLKGFSQTGLHPGAYARTGLDFEFGTRNSQVSALEAGVTLDYSPIPVAIMADNPKQSLFMTLYVSLMFGKRYN
ncbi:MAG TPA: hypothetical protein PKG48_10050, partial [Bacteroidales bacterium]|nr:hypothetical protein [Bacteroidales bacterium]